MAEIIIIRAKNLGMRCWNPLRFLDRCHQCYQFKFCKYPEKRSIDDVLEYLR